MPGDQHGRSAVIVADMSDSAPLSCTLHAFVAFDWGDEIDLEQCLRRVPSELHLLPRNPRTPTSIQYQPAPLRFRLQPPGSSISPRLPSAVPDAAADATVFDFGGVTVALHVPLQLPPAELANVAGALWDSSGAIQSARECVAALFDQLQPCIRKPEWRELTEEYFVFEFGLQSGLGNPAEQLSARAPWLAGLIRLESAPLSPDEIYEALKSRITYGPQDLVIADWAGAIVIGGDNQEALDVLAFANLQLLEFRQLDRQLDHQLNAASRLSHSLSQSWLPFWRTHARQVRALGTVKIDAHLMFERTTSSLKLVGDPYLARLYHLVSTRFHLEEWSQSIRGSLSVLEGIYEALTDQSAMYRAEFLEITIVLLILYEIISAMLR